MDTCMLCKSSKKDEIQYGKFLKNKHFGVHTFCLYLSSNLSQNGEDDEGFLGFLEADIKQEVKRISLLKCYYCHKKYANIGCCEKKCRRNFHFICGLENKAENRFCHDFRSYCHRHVRKIQQRPSPKETCLICYENLCNSEEKFSIVSMILTPCCRNGWFHKLCLQKFANTAGYFFKCPLCNDSNIFREKLPSRGIFIPNQDAAWELEPNAFAELLERPSECAAEECKNKKGRKATSQNNPFILCSSCGSTAMHRQCLPNGGQIFHCADCTIALEEGDSGRESLNINHDDDNDEDDYVDVCHVSDIEDCDIINRLIGTGGNKRDSGSEDHQTESSDEENITHKTRQLGKNRRVTEENDIDLEEIKTSQAIKTKRLRSHTEDSKSKRRSDNTNKRIRESIDKDIMNLESYTDDNKKPCNVSQTRLLKSDSEEENDTEDEIRPRCHRNNRRLKTDSESSATSGPLVTSRKRTTRSDNTNKRIRESTDKDIMNLESYTDDNKKPCNVSQTRRLKSDSEEENDTEDEIRPRCHRNNRRLKTDSESSATSGPLVTTRKRTTRSDNTNKRIRESTDKDIMNLESYTDDNKKPCNVSQTRRLKSDSEEENDNEDEIRPRCHRNNRRLKTDSESSATIGPLVTTRKRTTATTLTNSEEDEQDHETKSVQNRRFSTEEEIIKPNRKRKSSTKLFDTDDEEVDEVFETKLKCLETKAGENEEKMYDSKNKSLVIEDSDEDDDPLENFSKIIEKQKNISFIALRTRRSHSSKTNNSNPPNGGFQVNTEKDNKENEVNLTNSKGKPLEEKDKAVKRDITNDKKTKKNKFAKLKDDNPGSNILDISCIAKRTRRKSMYNDINIFQQQQENHSNISRTRRKTICSQTNYSQESFYEMSQIYEKVQYSDEEYELVIEEETEPESETESELDVNEVDTDLDNFIVDDGYKENDSKFEISCIANRTRKRKSLKANNKYLSHFEEEGDSCSSTTSIATYNTISSSNFWSSNISGLNNLRKRSTQRLSPDEFTAPQIS